MYLPFLRVDNFNSWPEIFPNFPLTLSIDTKGEPLPAPINAALAISEDSLCFGGLWPATVGSHQDSSADSGRFVEGLWEGEVLELFILEPKSSRYIEINISPRGQWWFCSFDSYRMRSTKQRKMAIQVNADRTEHNSKMRVLLRCPLEAFGFDLSQARANVCGITGEVKRQYFSFARTPLETPDFHRSEFYLSIQAAA